MTIALVLLLAWIKIQLRQAFGRASWRWMVGDMWLTVATLAIGAGASTYLAVRFLGEWRRSPEIIHYLDWYLLIAVAFLSVASLLHFTVFLSSRSDLLFLHLSPAPRWKIYITRLSYALLFNLVAFLIISLPPLIIIELWTEGGSWGYVMRLSVVVGLISFAGVLIGAILAVPISFLLLLLPRRLRETFSRLEKTAMVFRGYLAATCLLPALLPPIPFPGWLSVARLIVIGFVRWSYLIFTVGGVVGLLGLFLWVYTTVFKMVPFEEQFATAKRSLVEAIRFRRFPLMLRDLASGWWLVVLLGVGSGIVIGSDARGAPVPMVVAVLVGLISLLHKDLLPNSGLSAGKVFFLVKSAPMALFSAVGHRFLALYLQVAVACIIAVSIYALQLRQAGDPWGEAFLSLSVLLPCLAFPLTATLLTRQLFTFHPSKNVSIFVAYGSIIIDLLLNLLLFVLVGVLLYYRPLLFWMLAWRAVAFFAVCVVGVYFLLRLAARRLSRIEWL